MIISVSVLFRLMEVQGEQLMLDQLSKDLKRLSKQTKATKYRDVMKLLRLALSGLQVPEGIVFTFILILLWNLHEIDSAELGG